MSKKLDFSDYEPLKRRSKAPGDTSESESLSISKGLKAKHDAEEPGLFSGHGASASAFPHSDTADEVGFQQTGNAAGGRVSAWDSDTKRNTTHTGTIADENSRDSSAAGEILKRGHAISFAGLFLFTVVLYFRPYELFPSLGWLSSIAFWIATLTVAVFIPTQLGLEGRITTRPREVSLVLLLVLAALLSIPFALDRSVAWASFTEYLKVVVIFIVAVNVVRTEKRLRALLLLALATGCFLSLGAVYDYQSGNLGLEGRRISGVIGGIFSNPNDLALHLVTMVPIAIGLLCATRNPLKKIAYLVCGILLVTGIIATFSRSGFIAFVAAMCFLTWKLAPRFRLVFGALGLLAILVIVGLAPGAFRTRIATTQDESALARFDDLKRSVFLMVRHPLFGVGMGNYVIYSNRAKATHNAYTQVGAELGIAAAVIYVLFVIAPIKSLRRLEIESFGVRKKPRLYYLSIALQASLIGYMVASFFASVAYLWYVYYLVAYAFCLRRIYQTVPVEGANGTVANVSGK